MEHQLLRYTRRIHEVYPELAVRTVRRVEHGQNNDIVVVNDRVIFRFPRYASGIAQLAQEVGVLRALRQRVPVPIPDPCYASFSPRAVGQVFMGYHLLTGASLQPATLGGLDEAARRALGAHLGHFLASLHRVPLRDALPHANEQIDPRTRWEHLYARIRQRLFPLMRPDARARAEEHFQTFLRDPRHRGVAPVLVHGDFGGSNILYDAWHHAPSGIIDFGSAGPDDPAVDLAAASTLGSHILAGIADTYPEAHAARDRVAFYTGTFALQEALFGLENNDAAALRAGLAGYV